MGDFLYELEQRPWRRQPAQFHPGAGWFQGGHRLPRRSVKKPYYHFIWPKDGKRNGTWGRIKDILTNEGPDIHVAISADKNDYMWNRQRRSRWARWTHLDDLRDGVPDGSLPNSMPWVREARHPDIRYDFRTRKYQPPQPWTWTDALYGPEPGRSDAAYALRNMYGLWYGM